MKKRTTAAFFFTRIWFCMGLMAVLAGCQSGVVDPTGLTSSSSHPSTSASAAVNSAPTDATAKQVLDLTNQQRVANGLSALKWNSLLAQVGAAHCQDMIDKSYFAHESPDGTTPASRATAAGYNWSWIGENIAAGYPTPQAVMTGWMNSPEHRDNILRRDFTELGVGIRAGTDGRLYWAQEFGTPMP